MMDRRAKQNAWEALKLTLIAFAIIVLLQFAGCNFVHAGTPTPTKTPVLTFTPTFTPTNTKTNTKTNTPTFTATPTNTPTNTPTPTPTFTKTNTPTNTPTPTPTFTNSNTPTNTPTFTVTPTPTWTWEFSTGTRWTDGGVGSAAIPRSNDEFFAVGYQVGGAVTGSVGNTYGGTKVFDVQTGGGTNTGFGASNGNALLAPSNDSFFGADCADNVTVGNNNTASGFLSMERVLNGADNSCYGYGSGDGIGTLNQGCYFGENSGIGAGGSIGNTAMGWDTETNGGHSYGIIIGYGMNVTCGADFELHMGINNHDYFAGNALSNTVTLVANTYCNSQALNAVADPTTSQQAATKNYVDTHSGNLLSGTVTFAGTTPVTVAITGVLATSKPFVTEKGTSTPLAASFSVICSTNQIIFASSSVTAVTCVYGVIP